jgi:hypothetical protein
MRLAARTASSLAARGPRSLSGLAALAALAAAGLAALTLTSGGCGRGGGATTPVASLASSVQAASSFAAIRDAWGDAEETPATLRAMLERFLSAYPRDGQASLARAALAIVAIEQGDFDAADLALKQTEDVPTGTAQDLRTVARARRLRARGESEAALLLLRPLVGKNVDPLAREVFEKELTLDAMSTDRAYEAISYMDAWLKATPEEDRPRTSKTVTGIVRELPPSVLESELDAMRAGAQSFGYGPDIERILAARLVEIATTTGDTRLARLLLDPDAGSVAAGDAGAALSELATSRRGLNVVDGRTLGLLLPTESPGLRDEAADVLRGTMWALGLPRGVRARTATPKGDAGVPPVPPPCAPLEQASDVSEPGPEDKLHLLTRDDSGNPDRTEASLDELAGAGAAIIVAGFDPPTAARAIRWAEQRGVALVALVPPGDVDAVDAGAPASAGPRGFGFILGERRERVIETLVHAAPALASPGAVAIPLIDTGETTVFAAEGGPFGALTLGPPVSCDIPPVQAGAPRFPVTQWDTDKRHAWLVSGSAECAVDATAELSEARSRGIVALTLEAAALPPHAQALRVVTASAGVVPQAMTTDARSDELVRFGATLGRITWWTALGRDAATLVRAALLRLSTEAVSEGPAVAERGAQARDSLAASSAHLWSTEAASWTADRGGYAAYATYHMRRTLCAIDSAAATPPTASGR